MISELYIPLKNGLEMDRIDEMFNAFLREIPFSGRVTIFTKRFRDGISYQVARCGSEESDTWDVLDRIEQRNQS